jgi:uncharacterized membrane protein YkgB
LIGLWVFCSPWILRFKGLNPITTNAWIVGIMVMLVALLALITYEKWQGWLGTSLGVWLVISPRITGVSTHPDIVLK